MQCRQTLKKPSSAKQPLRRPALMKLRKEEKAKDPLVGNSLLSPSKMGCEIFTLQKKTKKKGELS